MNPQLSTVTERCKHSSITVPPCARTYRQQVALTVGTECGKAYVDEDLLHNTRILSSFGITAVAQCLTRKAYG